MHWANTSLAWHDDRMENNKGTEVSFKHKENCEITAWPCIWQYILSRAKNDIVKTVEKLILFRKCIDPNDIILINDINMQNPS
jgi:hypothetical protein